MRAITLGLGLIVSLGFGAGAQTLNTNNTRSMSLEECIQSALQRNLSIQISRTDVNRIRGLMLNTSGYYDPVFETRANYSSTTSAFSDTSGQVLLGGKNTEHALQSGFVGALPWGMRYDIGADVFYRTATDRLLDPDSEDYTLDTGIALVQPLLRNFWIDAGRMAIKLNRYAFQASELELLNQIHTVVRDVQLNYYELVFAIENVRVNEKAFELSQRLAAENKKRVEVGTMAPLDEKQAEAQAATARADLIAALQLAGTQQRTLINLITDNYEEWQGRRLVPAETLVAVPQSYNLTASWVDALVRRPDFNRSKALLEQKGVEVKFQRNQLFPQLDLVGTYGRRGFDQHFSPAVEDIRDETLPRYSFGLVFSIPLENRTARGSLRARKEERERLQLEMQQLKEKILMDVEVALGAAQAEFQKVAATREASLAAEAAFDAEVKKLENGKSTSFNVLSLQNDLTTARSQQIRALADYNRALTELYFNEGTILERNKITVER